MSEAIAFFCGLIAMAIVWFIQDTKYNPYMRGYADGLNDGIQEVNRMGDYISRRAAIDAINRAVTKEAARWSVEELPSAQPEPPEECERCMMEHTDEMEKLEAELAMAQPKRGRWISADAIFGGVPFYCSECGENTRDTVMGKPRWNFCPNCGADMRGGQNESD